MSQSNEQWLYDLLKLAEEFSHLLYLYCHFSALNCLQPLYDGNLYDFAGKSALISCFAELVYGWQVVQTGVGNSFRMHSRNYQWCARV